MTFDIIQPNYFENLKHFGPYYKWVTGIGFSLMLLDSYSIDILPDNKVTTIIFIVVVLFSFILFVLNNALFTRIGHITFEDEKIIIMKNEVQSEFLISNIKHVTIRNSERKQYFIKASPLFEEVIELDKHDLIEFKNHLTKYQIAYKHTSILNWLKNLRFTKSN